VRLARSEGREDGGSEATTVYYYSTITNNIILVASLLVLCSSPFAPCPHDSATGTLSTLHDATERDLPEKILRLSPHYFNTQEDIDKVVEGLLYVKSRNK
jgi:hypothetical protein